jgi:uncharacterized protein YjlB
MKQHHQKYFFCICSNIFTPPRVLVSYEQAIANEPRTQFENGDQRGWKNEWSGAAFDILVHSLEQAASGVIQHV